MPHIVARCPKCKKKYSLKNPDLVGKKIKCRNCDTPFRIKALQAAKAPDDDFESDDYDPFAEFDGYDESAELPSLSPRRRKLKQSNTGAAAAVDKDAADSSESNFSKPLVITVAVGGSILLIGMITAMVIFGPGLVARVQEGPQIQVPKNFVDYNPPDSSVRFEYPQGWEPKHGGGSGGQARWARIKHNGIEISIRSTMAISAKADTMRASQGGQIDPDVIPSPEEKPVHKLHMFIKETKQREFEDYEETRPEILNTKMGEARICEYKYSETFNTVHGVRATMPPSVNTFTVTITCTEKQLKVLKQTFYRIIESIDHGASR